MSGAPRRPDTPATMSEEEAYARLSRLFEVVAAWGDQNESPVEVQDGSRMAADDVLADPYHLSHAIAVSIGVARDHLQALRALVVDAGVLHMATPFTLGRAALESAAQALWLLEPDDQRERVMRRFQMAVRDAKERHAATDLLGIARPETLQRRLDRLADLGEAAGVTRHDVLRRAPGWAKMVHAAGPTAGVTGEQLESLWNIASGYAHGQSWSLLSVGSLDPLTDPEASDVTSYLITADVPQVWTLTSTAVLLLQRALALREKHRLRWRTSTARP
jgi:hypothetical protein